MQNFRPSYLFSFYLESHLQVADVVLEEELRVGRSSGNDVLLDHPGISRHHATFFLREAGDGLVLTLRDEGSTNGCRVNGRRVRDEESAISPDDTVTVGPFAVKIIEARTSVRDIETLVGDDPTIEVVREPSNEYASLDDKLQVLYRFVSTAIDYRTEELVSAAAFAISECIDFDVLCILFQTKKGLAPAVTWNHDGPCSAREVAISRTVLKQSVEKGVGIIAGSRGHDPEATAVLESLMSAVCVPLVKSGEILGAIYLSSSSPEVIYEQVHLETISLFANTLVANISSSRAFAALQAEKQKLEAILDGLQEGVVVTDDELEIVSANRAARQIFSDSALIGKSVLEVIEKFAPGFRTEAIPGLNYFQLEERSPQTGETSEPERIFSVTVSSREIRAQGDWQYVYCFHDTTKHRRLERGKSLLVNRLTHKLITPLTIISSANQLAMEHVTHDQDSELYEILKESNDTCKEYAELVRRLMRYTQMISSDGFRPRVWSECPVEELLREAADANQEFIDEKSFDVVWLFPRARMKFRGDREMLGIVFMNVIQNAVKFGPHDGTLLVKVEPSGDMLKVSFQDNGPGIPPSEVEHLGVLLHQFDPHDTGEIPGAGIGLAIVNEVVHAHGGRVKIESPTGKDGGTLVEILLPGSAPGQAGRASQPKSLSESTTHA